MEHNPTICFRSTDTLVSDVICALERANGTTNSGIEFARSELGYAILQLASGRTALDGAHKPEDVHTVNAQRLTLRAIATRFVSEKMLRASNSSLRRTRTCRGLRF